MSAWRAVVGFEGLYEVSDDGKVRSIPRRLPWRGTFKDYPSRELKQNLVKGPRCTKGHLQVYLSRGGKVTCRYVHNLVLEAFECPRPEGLKGLHRDDDPYHNHIVNLYWGTDSDNALDIIRNGNNMNVNKTHCSRGHLLEGDNLGVAALAAGHRACKICQRARSRKAKVDASS